MFMMVDNLYSFTFNTNDERDRILNENRDYHLVEERNTSEGNVLIFSDMSVAKYIQSLEDQLLLAFDAAEGGIL